MDHAMAMQFHSLLKKLGEKFGGDGEMDLNSVLFIIGVQEVGKGYRKYSKDEKMNLMHVAICTILEPYGFYKFRENDPDGWPHFDKVKNLPAIELKEQEDLLKEAAVNYFLENKLVDLEG
ncbi:MAG: hypothetical protein HYZ14_00695 [Bacteroidetes bacterium]|nr:hypothetical protein [Bacteroidota bacterium]